MFKVIEGTLYKRIEKEKKKKEFLKQKYHDLYLNYQYGFESEIDIKKAIYFGIKYILLVNINELDYRSLFIVSSEISNINQMISNLTYNEFINMFPITKDFDGKKFESKDYYSTIEYLDDFNLDEKIDDVQSFFWNYYNTQLMNYAIKEMLIYDRILKYQSRPTLLEGFLDEIDPEGKIETYKYNKEHNYLQSTKTGKIHKIKQKKRIPKYLKVIKED